MHLVFGILSVLTVAAFVTGSSGANAVFELNVWNHPIPERATQFQRNYMVPENLSLFSALNVVTKNSKDFSFETKYFKGMGNYIVSVNGVAEKPSEKKYWMIYKLPDSANVQTPPTKEFQTPKGIDQTEVTNRDVYLLWLQQFD